MYKDQLHKYMTIISIFYYYCNRAGNYQTHGSNERSVKSQGSNKAVSHCSAYIQATVNVMKGVVYAKYSSNHYNHELQLGNLPIATSTRNTIANKLRHAIISWGKKL